MSRKGRGLFGSLPGRFLCGGWGGDFGCGRRVLADYDAVQYRVAFRHCHALDFGEGAFGFVLRCGGSVLLLIAGRVGLGWWLGCLSFLCGRGLSIGPLLMLGFFVVGRAIQRRGIVLS